MIIIMTILNSLVAGVMVGNAGQNDQGCSGGNPDGLHTLRGSKGKLAERISQLRPEREVGAGCMNS